MKIPKNIYGEYRSRRIIIYKRVPRGGIAFIDMSVSEARRLRRAIAVALHKRTDKIVAITHRIQKEKDK